MMRQWCPRAVMVVALTATGSWSAPTVAAQDSEDPAVIAYRTGRYEESINAFRQRSRDGSSSAADYRNLVTVLTEVGRYDEAEAAALEFIAADSASSEVHTALGEAYWATGRYDEAESAFQQAIAANASDRLVAEVNLAIAAFDRGRREEAMQRFDRFIDYYNDGIADTAAELTAVGIACQYLGIQDSALFQDALKAFDEAVAADANNLEPRIFTGILFLEKNDSGSATTELANVLQVNPQQPDAQLAMARRMTFDNEPGAAGMADGALVTNPNMVAARVFRARAMLTAERFDEAAVEIETALETNPNHTEALAVLATAHYLRADMPAFEQTRDRVLAINPNYAELYNTLAELLVQNRYYGQAVEFAQRAVELDPQSWRGYSILGVNQLRIGDIAAGTASLTTAFAGDPYNVWVKNTLDLLDTFPDYVESSTDRFDLMVERGPESELLALYLGELAEEAYDYFESRYGYAPATPIRIEVYPSHADFSVRTVGLAGLGALGVSFGPVIAIDSPSARPIGEFNWGSTLWHEIAHTFTLGTTDFRIPRWVSEGLSVYEERRARPSWGDDVSASFLYAHLRDMLLPVSRITEGFVRPQYPEQVIHAYFQASLVFELIERDWGFAAILGLLDGYKRGLSTEAAFLEVLDIDIADFDAAFTTYVETEYATTLATLAESAAEEPAAGRQLTAPSPRELEQRALATPIDFRAQLSYGISLFEEERYDEALPFFDAAKALFPRYSEAASPYWYLAQIARRQGDLRRAAEELETLTGINEKLYIPNAELADIYDELGEPVAAAAALERLIYIYPLEIATHQRLAGLYEQLADHTREIRERKAVVALAPTDMAEAWYQLARAQFRGNELSGARRSILRSLEIAPSYPDAQDLLLEIVSGGLQ